MAKWSSTFVELVGNRSKALDMQQYDLCLSEWQAAHERKSAINTVVAILLFLAGLWTVWANSLFLAVLLLALAADRHWKSSDHALIHEMLGSQRLLAMLINKQSH